MSAGQILVIRGGAIGDFILTLPALRAIRDAFPQAKMEILGYPRIADLACFAGLADDAKAIEAPALAEFFAAQGTLDEDWMEYFGRFDVILSYLYDPDGIFQNNVRRCPPAHSKNVAEAKPLTFIQGAHRPEESGDIPAAEVFLEPLKQLAIFNADSRPQIRIPRQISSERNRLAVHPGSGSLSKNWTVERWRQLIAQIQEKTNWNLLLVGGEAEREIFQRLQPSLDASRSRLEFCAPLPQLASLLAECGGFIGHDSGISHLAAAVGLPGLVLWGESKETVWRPRSDQFVVVRHKKGLRHLPVEQVFAQFRERFGTGEGDISCLESPQTKSGQA